MVAALFPSKLSSRGEQEGGMKKTVCLGPPSVFCFLTSLLVVPHAWPAAADRFAVEIKPQILVSKPVSPWIYGNFVELGLGHQVDRMWAEMLWNRSFEEVTPLRTPVWDWISRTPADDLAKEAWWHSGYEENDWYVDPANAEAGLRERSYSGFRHGVQAAGIRNESKTLWAVFAQDGIHVRKGMTYRFTGWMGSGEVWKEKVENPIRVKVGLYPEKQFSRPLDEKEITVESGAFKEFSADLQSRGFEGRASFALSVEPGAQVAADAFSLMPSDNVRGWRRDLVEAMKCVRPPILRFPGGCFASFYEWRDGTGPRIDRRPRQVPFWGGLENNDVGVAELVGLCREVGAEPFYCLNVMTRSAEEAADLVAYCNADESHPLGLLRARHGYREPFRIRYWELDNEIARRLGALEYASRCVAFAKAIKAVDPSVGLVMIAYDFEPYLAQMLEIAGEWIDGITDRAMDEAALRRDLEVLAEYERSRGRSLFLCNTEWISWQTVKEALPGAALKPGEELEGTLQNREVRWGYALTAAAELLAFQRLGGHFLWSNFNNLVNTWGQNIIECAKEGVWLSAAGRMFELVTGSPAAWPLEHKIRMAHPNVIFQAAWDKEKKSLVAELLNFGAERISVSLDFKSLGFKAGEARVSTLWADSLQAQNTLANPEAVRRSDRTEKLKGKSSLSLEVPQCSLSLIILIK
jgi:alpha-N-arabinofuranosidase